MPGSPSVIPSAARQKKAYPSSPSARASPSPTRSPDPRPFPPPQRSQNRRMRCQWACLSTWVTLSSPRWGTAPTARCWSCFEGTHRGALSVSVLRRFAVPSSPGSSCNLRGKPVHRHPSIGTNWIPTAIGSLGVIDLHGLAEFP